MCVARERVFLGYTNVHAGHRNRHVDFIEWHKGRETEFSAAAGFLFKISAGASTMMRSRTLQRCYLDMRLDLFTKQSLFFGSLGSYFGQWLSYLGSLNYLLLFFLLAVSGALNSDEFNKIGENGLVDVPIPWVAIINLAPLLAQKLIENPNPFELFTGTFVFETVLSCYLGLCFFDVWSFLPGWLPSSFLLKYLGAFLLALVVPSVLFFSHGNRYMVQSFVTSHETGKAGYVNTGRPPPYERTKIHHLYCRFAVSHFEPAVTIVAGVALILLLTRSFKVLVRLGV